MTAPKKKLQVFIVSDATGLTAEMVISAVLVQFGEIDPVFRKFPYTATVEQLKAIIAQAEAARGIVIYSLVSQELRSWISKERLRTSAYVVDLLGPLLDRIGTLLDVIPALRPGLLRRISEESMRLAEAIDFTLKHDDGQNIETVNRADLVILGVSRTSKTPTSLYLSCNHSLKVVNVPIIEGVRPPDEVFRVEAPRVGLIIAPERLANIRERRFGYAGPTDYIDLAEIKNELAYSRRIFTEVKVMQVIDVTNNSIEETANKVLEVLPQIKKG